MRVVAITVGSEGDVRPYVALCAQLRAAGHDACVATHALFEPLVRGQGLDFAPVAGDPRMIVSGAAGRAWLDSGVNPAAFAYGLRRVLAPLMYRAFEDAWRACQQADAVVVSILASTGGHAIAEKLGIPCFRAFLVPMTPTRAFPNPYFSSVRRLGSAYNLATHYVVAFAFWLIVGRAVERLRRRLGLRPLRSLRSIVHLGQTDQARAPILYGYSPTLLPSPPDWDRDVHVTGAWQLDRDPHWAPSPELVDFLASGPPPVYVGFGSMTTRAPREQAVLVAQALARAGQRGIMLTGWGGLAGDDRVANVFQAASVPHDWLFPRVAAVVHHGGIGTVSSGLRAGVPAVTAPFFGDQMFWGQRLFRLGVGPAPIPQRRLTVERLAEAVTEAVHDPHFRTRAAAVMSRVREEDGARRAVEILQRAH